MNLKHDTDYSSIYFSEEELICYETWYSIIQNFNDKCLQEREYMNIHDIPKIGIVTAQFLKTSGLPVEILHEIWRIVDEKNEGSLTFLDFGKACRLVAFYQHEKKYPLQNLMMQIPSKLPYFNIENFWNENLNLRNKNLDVKFLIDKYFSDSCFISECVNIFKDLDDKNNGFVDGVKIFNIFINSNLSRDVLKEIWNFSDLDGDGKLSITEFIIFNALVKINTKYNIMANGGISIQSIVILLNNVMKSNFREMYSEAKFNTPKSHPVKCSTEDKNLHDLNSEIDTLENEISDIDRVQTVLSDLKHNDIQLINRLNEKRIKLMNEHRELLQRINKKYGALVRNRDLIGYLYEDIQFFKEANQMISDIDIEIPNKDLKIVKNQLNVKKESKQELDSRNEDSVRKPIRKFSERCYNDWVVFPSKERSVEYSADRFHES